MKPFFLFLIPLIIVNCAFASSPEVAPNLSTSFRVFPWNTETEDLYVFNGQNFDSLKSMTNNISHLYSYTGPNPMGLYRKVGIVVDGKKQDRYELVSEVDVLNVRDGSLLFVLKSDSGEPKARLYPFELDALGGNSVVLFNFTEVPIRAKVGELVLEVESGQFETLNADGIKVDENGRFRCKVAFAEEGAWRLVYNRMGYVTAQSRVLMLVSRFERNSGRPDIKLVRDFVLDETTRGSHDTTEWTKPVNVSPRP